MKKTLALALVAAMTISVASMTAFAKVEYNDGAKDASLDQVTAKVTLTAEEIAKLKENDETITFGELGLKDYSSLNTATKTFKGWYKGNAASDSETALEADADLTSVFTADTAVSFAVVYETTNDDEQIAKNLENIEKAKNAASDADAEKKRMEELDKKYNADGKNGYDKTSKEDKELKGEATLKEIKEKNAQDYAWHAIQVAGVTDDTTKTWVYDVNLPDGTALYAGKTARTTLTIDGVKGDLSKFGVKVYHIEGWCKAVPVKNVDVKGNTVTFWASDFSPYVVTIGDGVASTGAADASNPSTGDFSAVPVALLAAAALGATGFVAYKKRKAE